MRIIYKVGSLKCVRNRSSPSSLVELESIYLQRVLSISCCKQIISKITFAKIYTYTQSVTQLILTHLNYSYLTN